MIYTTWFVCSNNVVKRGVMLEIERHILINFRVGLFVCLSNYEFDFFVKISLSFICCSEIMITLDLIESII